MEQESKNIIQLQGKLLNKLELAWELQEWLEAVSHENVELFHKFSELVDLKMLKTVDE